jgi:hypothetical protein
MATLATVFNRLPQRILDRFGSSSKRIDWANGLLEDLSNHGFLPEIEKEDGVLVSNKYWIDKPEGYKRGGELFAPQNTGLKYSYDEVNNKLKLTDFEFDDEAGSVTISAFSAFDTESITADITDYDEDDFEDWLFVITAGTYAGRTYVIGRNDESGVSFTKLYLLHDLTTALDGTTCTAGKLVDPDYYIMLHYWKAFDAIAADTDEIPIGDPHERNICDKWFRYQYEGSLADNEVATREAKFEYERARTILKGAVRGDLRGPIRGKSFPKISRR